MKVKAMKRSDKMDFAVETAIVTLAGGAVILQMLMAIFLPTDSSYLKAALWLIPNILRTFLIGFPGLLVFGLAFRLMIYLLDIAPFQSKVKMLLSILAGVALILFLEHFYINFRTAFKEMEGAFLALSTGLSFIAAFLYWVLKRNIWDAVWAETKEVPNILDHFE